MTAVLAPDSKFKAFSNDGFPLAFGLLHTYAAGTTIAQATYKDSTQSTPNTNPVVLNFRGEADVWLDPSLTYKFLLTDALGFTIPGWPVDNIPGGPFTLITADLLPTPTNTVNLGGPLNTFKNLYLGTSGLPLLDTTSGNILFYARTPAEASAGVTPVNYAYAPLNPLRYGAKGDGITNDWAAVQAAFNVAGQTNAGLSGGTVLFPSGYTFLCNADVIVPVPASLGNPVPCAQGPGWSNTAVIFGVGSNHGFVILGTGATTGGVTSTAYNDAGSFRDMLIELTNTGSNGNAFYCNSVSHPRIQNCWIRGSATNGVGAYFLNCLVPAFEDCLVTGCGSATQGSVEFDTCTSVQWRGSRISGGNTTKGGLLIDRCTTVVIDGCASESCGVPIAIGSKTESALACVDILMQGLELENPGNGNPYIDIGAGLSGSALVIDVLIDGLFGSPSGTTTVAYAVRMQNASGVEIRGSHFTFGTSPTSCFELVGTNLSGITIRPHRNLASLAVPWVRYNGTQVLAAGPFVEYQFTGELQSGRPICQNKGLAGVYDASNLSGATPSILVSSTMGGFYASKVMANASPTTVTSLSGGEPGMEIILIAADGNTTLTNGNSGGAFRLIGGANLTLSAGHAYKFINDGANGAAGSCWVQL